MSHHGRLGLGSPWTRALFPGDLRAEVEALIPAHHIINVTAVDGKPGPWRLTAYRIGEPIALVTWVTRSPVSYARSMAQQLRESVAA